MNGSRLTRALDGFALWVKARIEARRVSPADEERVLRSTWQRARDRVLRFDALRAQAARDRAKQEAAEYEDFLTDIRAQSERSIAAALERISTEEEQ